MNRTFISGAPVQLVAISKLGPDPCQVKCTWCQATIVTRTTSTPGLAAWMIGLGLCLAGYV